MALNHFLNPLLTGNHMWMQLVKMTLAIQRLSDQQLDSHEKNKQLHLIKNGPLNQFLSPWSNNEKSDT